ncbi:MAG TPA: FtsH protease activity modulator HflK [Dehalococcoidia bacterium]|jgi:membrane protease subunit HflK|nr:FtsH protease activity modulator HflK [Dehalococcoidia bacterium]|tara:strand:+ start:249 stop:1307 length:1059 start_codon:yes stop_codon:yes gene_type:complete
MYGERKPEFDPDELMRNLKANWGGIFSRLPGGGNRGVVIAVILVLLAVAWAASGVFTVGPGEQAATRLFGKFTGTEGPGLRWYYPAPIGARNIENVLETKRMELGFRSNPSRDVPVESTMITGDLNIVDARLVVQYRISDLEKFLFRVDDPGDSDRDSAEGRPDGRTLKDATEAALRQVVGQRSIDDVLTVGKEAVQQDTRTLLQEFMTSYNAGIQILEVALQEVTPPDEVRAAFDDVVAARSDKETRVNQANAYEQDRIPKAEGAAQQTVQSAEAFKASRVAQARGEASGFLEILEEYAKSKEVTRTRLYLEEMEKTLSGVEIFVVDEKTGGVLPFLPLTPGAASSVGGGS